MTLPVELNTVMPVIGYKAVVDGLIALHEMNGSRLGTDRDRVKSLHGQVIDRMDGLSKKLVRAGIAAPSKKPGKKKTETTLSQCAYKTSGRENKQSRQNNIPVTHTVG